MMRVKHRWETEQRYYEVLVTKDLFDNYVLITAWGGKYNKHAQVKTVAVGELQILSKLAQIQKARLLRGYRQLF